MSGHLGVSGHLGMSGYLGLDIGGTKVALRAGADGREPYETSLRWPVPADHRADLTALAGLIAGVRDRWDTPITSVGMAVPATLDAAGRVTTWPGRPYWAGVDLLGEARGWFPGARLTHADDGDLAALAEADAAGEPDVVYLGAGTGVGGGIVLGGRLLPLPGGVSCELGHVLVETGGPLCDCGRRGCAQAVASGPATIRRAARERGSEVTDAELREAWIDRRPWAVTAVDAGCAALATVVLSVAEIAAPAVAVIGGGFASALPGYAATVAEHLLRWERPGRPVPRVRAASLGALSSLRGAVLLARTGLV